LSIHNFKNITIVHNGVNLKPLEKPLTKFENFTLVFLNRIVKMKGPERAIEIFSEVKKIIPNSKLVLIGNGEKDYLEELNIIVKKLNLYESVNILGFVPEEEKLNYLRKSHVLINTSFKEGWGLVNIEANTQGTAAVAFDVEGCRDSIKNGINGYISKDSKEFVSNILKIKENNLAKESLEYSKEFNWDLKAEEFYQQL
ncbi:MAG: glycosyltransferase, partial [Proteobacteria bacterium]|nr:glycosyltransferase [Pseudomonadota bacterium]